MSEYGVTSEVRYSGPISLLTSAKPEWLVSIKQTVRHGEIEAFAIYIIMAVWFICLNRAPFHIFNSSGTYTTRNQLIFSRKLQFDFSEKTHITTDQMDQLS